MEKFEKWNTEIDEEILKEIRQAGDTAFITFNNKLIEMGLTRYEDCRAYTEFLVRSIATIFLNSEEILDDYLDGLKVVVKDYIHQCKKIQ